MEGAAEVSFEERASARCTDSEITYERFSIADAG
jgi:hypothetical protein